MVKLCCRVTRREVVICHVFSGVLRSIFTVTLLWLFLMLMILFFVALVGVIVVAVLLGVLEVVVVTSNRVVTKQPSIKKRNTERRMKLDEKEESLASSSIYRQLAAWGKTISTPSFHLSTPIPPASNLS